MIIRQATEADFDAIWPIFHQIAAAGDTYAYSPDINKQEARRASGWSCPPKPMWLQHHGQILGTYYIKTNQAGPGAHVCNCGYMVSADGSGYWVGHCYV